jgi:hypothetical protein
MASVYISLLTFLQNYAEKVMKAASGDGGLSYVKKLYDAHYRDMVCYLFELTFTYTRMCVVAHPLFLL